MLTRPPTATLADAAAFIADAEAITNRRDLHALDEIFAPTAVWTVLIDGLTFTAIGLRDIRVRWAELCDFMQRRHITVDKHVIVHDSRTIVSGWSGHCPDGMSPIGYEIWRFDDRGKVAESTLTGYLKLASADSLAANIRYLCTSPRNALTFAATRLSSARSAHVR